MSRTNLWIGPVGLAACVIAGCGEHPFDGTLDLSGPYAADTTLVWIDHGRDQVVFVTPEDDEISVSTAPMGDERDRVAWATPTRDRQEMLVLRVPADDKQEDVVEQLLRFPADGDGEPVVYDVLSPFTSVALSPDHRTAVLYFGTASSEHLQNANLVALIDLEGDGVRTMTLNGFGGRLSTVHFPGQLREGEPAPVDIGGRARDIVAFLAAGEVVLVDMADPDLDFTAPPLGSEGQSFTPVATLLRPGNEVYAQPELFVRSSNGSDIAMIDLKQEEEAGFTSQLNLLAVGPYATDFVYHDEGDVPYLISVVENRFLVFTHIGTQESFSVDLEGSAQRVFLRDHEQDGDVVRQAVAWEAGSSQIHTLALDDIGSTSGRTPEHLKIETGIAELVQLDNDRVLVGSGTTLYVVDFPAEQVVPLTSQVAYDPKASALDGDVLFLGTPGQDWLSMADLVTFRPDSVVLDSPIQAFYYLRGSRKIVATHAALEGHVTIADADDLSRAGSYVAWGFLLDGVLDRPAEDKE
jgi:hypothetical protein